MKYVLFDLGGVLFHVHGYKPILRLLGESMTREDLHSRWVASQAVRLFETGGCDLNRFAELITAEFHFPVTPAEFASEFCSFQGEEMEGARQLVSELKGDVGLGCLSNTNPPHVATMKEVSSIFDLFDHCFLSCETGFLKPDPDSFRHAVNTVGVAGSDIMFLDDSRANVDAAKACGLNAELVASPTEARGALSRNRGELNGNR